MQCRSNNNPIMMNELKVSRSLTNLKEKETRPSPPMRKSEPSQRLELRVPDEEIPIDKTLLETLKRNVLMASKRLNNSVNDYENQLTTKKNPLSPCELAKKKLNELGREEADPRRSESRADIDDSASYLSFSVTSVKQRLIKDCIAEQLDQNYPFKLLKKPKIAQDSLISLHSDTFRTVTKPSFQQASKRLLIEELYNSIPRNKDEDGEVEYSLPTMSQALTFDAKHDCIKNALSQLEKLSSGLERHNTGFDEIGRWIQLSRERKALVGRLNPIKAELKELLLSNLSK